MRKWQINLVAQDSIFLSASFPALLAIFQKTLVSWKPVFRHLGAALRCTPELCQLHPNTPRFCRAFLQYCLHSPVRCSCLPYNTVLLSLLVRDCISHLWILVWWGCTDGLSVKLIEDPGSIPSNLSVTPVLKDQMSSSDLLHQHVQESTYVLSLKITPSKKKKNCNLISQKRVYIDYRKTRILVLAGENIKWYKHFAK